ncbi:MAG: hypothetical protein ACR2HF_02580 [Methylococcaceae bacterium]
MQKPLQTDALLDPTTLERMLGLKYNNHDPAVLSYIFSQLLKQPVVFTLEVTGQTLPCLQATLAIKPDGVEDYAIFKQRWHTLIRYFIPVIYRVTVQFEYPYLILDSDGLLDAIQLT